MSDIDIEAPREVSIDEASKAGAAGERVQLELEALPTMLDLDQLQSELDDIDRVLADLDADRPDRRER